MQRQLSKSHLLLADGQTPAASTRLNATRRRGFALLSALICVLILSAVAASLLRSVLAQMREVDIQAHQLQADALAQSALERGIQQLSANPAYTGEVWTPDVPGAPRLKATIEWVGNPSGGSLRVVCLVPADAQLPVRLERTATITLPSPTPDKSE